MDTIRSFLAAPKPSRESAKPAAPGPKPEPAAAIDAADDRDASVQALESQYKAQTEHLRDLHRAGRPKNTARAYDPKQKEWEEWCAALPGNTDGTWVTEDKLCLFLQQEVINRESRAPGYQQRKAKRKAMWKASERAKKILRTGGRKGPGRAALKQEEEAGQDRETEEKEEWDEEALNAQFTETIRYAQVNSYASAIIELYNWQSDDKASAAPPLRGPKLSTILESVRRDEDRVRRVNFIDRGLFTIASGYDVKGLKRAIAWCWEAASFKKSGISVESCLRTAADHLLG
jgi:hypothetical protein